MKKRSIALLVILVCLSAGCAKQEKAEEMTTAVPITEEATTQSEESITEAESAAEADIVVDMEEYSKAVTNDDGIVMLTVSENYPVVKIGDSEEATEKINTYYQKKLAALEEIINQDAEFAEEDYNMRTEEEQKNFHSYELKGEYALERADSAVISVTLNSYEYTGGAHGNPAKTADNFNSVTGEKLTFADITTMEGNAGTFVLDYILKLLEDPQYKDTLFEDYQDSVGSILTPDTWYFSQKGFVVIANPYLIAPYSSGTMEFTIPYKDFPYLKEEYK